jgi:hypothetical protein
MKIELFSTLIHLTDLIDEGGQITIGALAGFPCVAVANDEHNSLAMLVRKPGESIDALLVRLNRAVDQAWHHEIFIDEINGSD